MAKVVNTTINMIIKQLGSKYTEILIVVYTDSYSLYKCLVKLRTTKEKRLMINIIGLRQSYERREIAKIRQIDGKDNPADAITKLNTNKSLERLITTNQLEIRIEGQVNRV